MESLIDGFGAKSGWIAVRSDDRDAVVAGIGLTEVREASWPEALGACNAYMGEFLVTPPLPGKGGNWVLVGGLVLDPIGDGGELAELSARLGTEVQLFHTHRTVDDHAWMRAVKGQLVRAFHFSMESIRLWDGKPDAVEQQASNGALANYADVSTRPEALGLLEQGGENFLYVTEEDVDNVAREWSLSPLFLILDAAEIGPALIGRWVQ